MKRPEILAPAGDFTCLQAAIDAGADAVYFGLGEFSFGIIKWIGFCTGVEFAFFTSVNVTTCFIFWTNVDFSGCVC